METNRPPYFSLGLIPIGQYLLSLGVLLFLVSGFLSAIGMAWWVNKRINQPLSTLSHHSLDIINENTVNTISLSPHSLPEVAILASALNKAHSDINRLIKDRELFLAEISHDLRTPLSRLSMAIEMQEVHLSKYAEGMRADIEEMSMTINQTMELAHVNNALHEPWIEADINALLIEIKAKYQRATITLDLDLDNTLPALRFKRITLTRMLYNLIDNALKYGNGKVRLVSTMDGVVPTVSVKNLIPEWDWDNNAETLALANPFNGNLTSSSNKLGLEIVKRITKMHCITLDITTDTDTKTYTVTLRFRPKI